MIQRSWLLWIHAVHPDGSDALLWDSEAQRTDGHLQPSLSWHADPRIVEQWRYDLIDPFGLSGQHEAVDVRPGICLALNGREGYAR